MKSSRHAALIAGMLVLLIDGSVSAMQADDCQHQLAGEHVNDFHIAANGAVVYQVGPWDADATSFAVYSVPAEGGEAVHLADVTRRPFPSIGPDYQIAPDGSAIVYVTAENEQLPLYRVPIGGGEALRLSHSDETGVLLDYQISPDSRHVVYRIERHSDARRSLYSVPLEGGEPVELAAPVDDITSFRIAPDGQSVVYLLNTVGSAASTPMSSLHSIPIDGGEPRQLNDPQLDDGSIADYLFSPDSRYVLYYNGPHQEHPGVYAVFHLYSSPLADGGPTLISDELDYITTTPALSPVWVTPDGMRVVYISRGELVATPVAGRVDEVLYDIDYVQEFPLVWVTPDSRRVVFMDELWSQNLFSREFGSESTVRLASVGEGQSIFGMVITPDNQTIVYLSMEWTGSYERWRIYSVPISGGEIATLADDIALIEGGPSASIFVLSPDGSTVAYINDALPDFFDSSLQLYLVPTAGGQANLVSNDIVESFNAADYLFSVDSRYIVYQTSMGQGLALISTEVACVLGSK